MRAALSLAFFAFLPLAAQTIEVTPSRVLIDQPAAIRITGAQPNERLAIRAELIDGADGRWASQSEFIADAQGVIDTAKQAPVSGSYKEISATGPIWSMKPVASKEGRYQPPRNLGPQQIEFHLMRGSTVLSTAQLEQDAVAEGVRRESVHDGALRGLLFIPPGDMPHPGILVLGGSEGGLNGRRAAWFASHGYVALALAWFRFEDLPKELAGIPLEYFGQALAWMTRRPEVDPRLIAVSGTSRGGELALQLGAMYPVIKAVVAYVPANVRYPACCGLSPVTPAWTWKGGALPFGLPGRRGLLASPQTEIEVEHTQGPILVISGSDDGVWNSSQMTDAIMARLKNAHFTHGAERLNYPHAGHGAGRPEIVPSWQSFVRNPTSGREMEMGGTPKGNAESSLDAAPKVLAFLAKSLATQ